MSQQVKPQLGHKDVIMKVVVIKLNMFLLGILQEVLVTILNLCDNKQGVGMARRWGINQYYSVHVQAWGTVPFHDITDVIIHYDRCIYDTHACRRLLSEISINLFDRDETQQIFDRSSPQRDDTAPR
ncbi:hypothetical protein SFRURICE_018229 [Spodoptera frugiperda]|nr:hypothetical protein SFRURICE_018229 [Spodoptera frugiperda]